MAYSITDLKNDLIGILHGTTLDQILDVDALIYRAARQVLADCDPQETKKEIPLTSAIFNSVYDYASPVDLKGTKIIDIRPQVDRQKYDNMSQAYSKDFDIAKGIGKGENFNVKFNSLIKTLRIKNTFLPEGALLDSCDSITGSGTWVASGDASTLTIDNVNFVSGGGSLKFNLASSGSVGIMSNTLAQPVDLTNYLNQGTFFVWVYLPTASDFTSITLRVGSDSSNYYQINTTVTQQNTTFQNGWNLLAFNWLGATVVGSPTVTAIDYLYVAYNYNGNAQTGVRLDEISCKLGSIFDIVYYSKYMFRDASTGAFQEKVTDDANLVNLDTESINLLLYQAAILAAQQQQGFNATNFDAKFFQDKYNENLTKYKNVYKSEYQKPRQVWYERTTNNYNQWANERFVR